MMITLDPMLRRVQQTLRRWALDPRIHIGARMAMYLLAGFVFSAGSLAQHFQPLALGLCCACTGWAAFLAAVGGCMGYLLLWGTAGWQGVVWLLTGLVVVLTVGQQRICRQTPLLMPAITAFMVSVWGVVFQTWVGDTTPVAMYLLRVFLSGGSCWVFSRVSRGRDPVCEWLVWGLLGLCLAQLAPTPWLGLGYILGAGLCVAGAFPAAAMAGLGLDLSGVTPVPMTAVLCAGYLVRFLPRLPKWVSCAAPAIAAGLVMHFVDAVDLTLLPGLVLGGIAGALLPLPGRVIYRRGETGVAQVRLEMAAGVLAQTEQLLLEAPPPPVDEDALVHRAAERACGSCPCRRSCKDSRRIAQLPGPVLHKALLTPEEIPVQCRKSGRFLAELHRSQEQLRSIRADRERQQEYRAAVVQQFRFLSVFLQELSDQLPRRPEQTVEAFTPVTQIYGNRPAADNGDRCMMFPGVRGKYYVLLCDGMGTGLGAVQEGKTAAGILKRLLGAGYPAQHALRSLNSICALRERAGAVTVDLAELQLDTGRVNLYKWGAPPSWLVTDMAVERLGVPGPPPGISVTEYQESVEQFSLRRGELLVLVSDGIEPEQAMACCRTMAASSREELARGLMACGQLGSGDDATVVLVHLEPGRK